MALPVIPNTFRCTLNYAAVNGCSPVNVFHVQSTLGSAAAVAEALWTAEVEGLLLPVPAAFEPTSYTVIELDGSSASFEFPRPVGSETLCLAEDEEPIMEGAVVLSLRTGVRGPRGRGRLFIGPIGENIQNEGRIVGDSLTLLAPIWEEYITNLVGEDCVMSVASYAHAEANFIAGVTVQPYMATQRRRLLATR